MWGTIKQMTMKKLTSHKLGQYYSYNGEKPSIIVEVINGNYGNFIVLENGNIVSVCK